MRRCGFSDRMFYYNGSGEATYSMRLRYELSIRLTREMLGKAARKTFACFPDYRVRPVLKDGRIVYEENPLPIPVFWNEEGHAGRCYGSDEVNGYLFVVSGEEHALTFSMYHGLTDFIGYSSILHTLMKNLMAQAGIEAEDPLAREDSSPYDCLDVSEREDPYSRYADDNVPARQDTPAVCAMVIPDRGERRDRFFDLIVPEQGFLDRTRECGTSFVPLLAMVFSRAVNEVYGIKDLPVVTKVPVNLRPIFHTATTVNFSDSATLAFPREYLSLSGAEQGKALREMLNRQLTTDNFAPVMTRKIRTIEAYEKSARPIEEISRSIMEDSREGSRPVTLGVTYIGKQSFPKAYQERITDISFCAYTPTNGIFATVMACGGSLKLRIQTAYEQRDFMEALAEEMRRMELETELREAFLDCRDLMDISRLKTL